MKVKFLGCKQEWPEIPEAVKKCDHPVQIEVLKPKTYVRHTCYVCGISYTNDTTKEVML